MKVVIIGGVAAGMSAASKLKRLMKDEATIVVYEKGEEISYGACEIGRASCRERVYVSV